MLVRQIVLTCLLLGGAMHGLTGCATAGAAGPQASQRFGPGRVTTETVNAKLIAFADDHALRVLETTRRLAARSSSLEDRARLNTIAVQNSIATVTIASGPNPIVGMTDMVVMVSLMREAMRRTTIDRILAEDERERPESYEVDDARIESILTPDDRVFYRALAASEREVRELSGEMLWPEQVTQLDALIAEWWELNPARRFVANVRLQDFAEYRAATVQSADSGPRNLLGFLYLDPLASMDPTTREIAQSRMLAERITYQVNRLPVIVSLLARGLLYESLTTDELVSVRAAIEGTEQTLANFVETFDRWPDDVAAERKAAIDQMRESIAVEREAAMERLAALVEVERQAILAEVEAAVARQRDEMLAAIDERTGPLQETLSDLDAALASAEALTGSINETVRSIDDMDVTDFQHLVESAADGVGGVERSLDTLERLLAPGVVDVSSSGLDQGVAAATAGAREVVDHAFWRAVQLVAIVLVGWVVAALCIRTLGPRAANRRPAP